jgi:hypothetical protein
VSNYAPFAFKDRVKVLDAQQALEEDPPIKIGRDDLLLVVHVTSGYSQPNEHGFSRSAREVLTVIPAEEREWFAQRIAAPPPPTEAEALRAKVASLQRELACRPLGGWVGNRGD